MSGDKIDPKTLQGIMAEQAQGDAPVGEDPRATPAPLTPRFRVGQPNWREVVFDCPWTGHQTSDVMMAVPKMVGNVPVVGRICLKCGVMVYTVMPVSNVVGPDGRPIVLPAGSKKD